MKIEVVAAWLLVEALKMPISKVPDETRDQLQSRLTVATNSLAVAARDQSDGSGWSMTELAAWGLVLWNEEARFDMRVHAGLPHPRWTQDDGLARCMGQLHTSRLIPPEMWARLAGTSEEATTQCARATLLVARAQGRRCGTYIGVRASRDRVAAVFAAYGSGGNCKPNDRAWTRADRWLKVMASRPDKSPVKGYRRVMPREIPSAVSDHAAALASFLGPEWPAENRLKLGDVQTFLPDPRYKLIIEKHARGKVGVSVLVRE
jgi:hypothetical protein